MRHGNFTTRCLTIEDYDPVAALWKASEGVEVAEGDSRREIAAYLRRNPNLSRLAELNGSIVGAVLCGHDGRRGIIYHLSVASLMRGQGIGRQLVDECVAGLERAGIKRALILVLESNESGKAFWTARGFERIPGAIPLGCDIP